VEEMDHKSKPSPPSHRFPIGNPTKRGRVLRAVDVIPPFDKDAQRPEDGVGIPSYDLAENILAEQRQAAGRRRRGPSHAGAGPCACPGAVGQPRGRVPKREEIAFGVPVAPADLASPDLRELQRVVAEIVARDIERLCRRPDRLPGGRSATRVA
jgi:hypothetical protein